MDLFPSLYLQMSWKPRLFLLPAHPYFLLAFIYCNLGSTRPVSGRRLVCISKPCISNCVLLPFPPVGNRLSTAREISPKCKLDRDTSLLNILSGVPGAPDHMALEVPGPFLQASPTEARWFLSHRNFPHGWFFHIPSELCPGHWFLCHSPCLLVKLAFWTIPSSVKFPDSTHHATHTNLY